MNNFLRLVALAVIAPLTAGAARAACGGFGAGFAGQSTGAAIQTIASTGTTGLNVSLASASANYTLYTGNPSLWGNLGSGGFVEYTVYAPSAGTYGLQVYYATTVSGTMPNVLVNGVQQGALNLTNTGSWGTMRMSSATNISLPSGGSVIRIAAQTPVSPFNLAGLTVTPVSTSAVSVANPSSPSNTVSPTAPATPGATLIPTIAVTGNGTTSVNIAQSAGASAYTLYSGNPTIWGGLQPGGWVSYHLNAATAGNYTLQLYYSTTVGGSAALTVNGVAQQPAPINNTGSWGTFSMSSPVTVNLPAGASTLTIGASSTAYTPFNLQGMTLAPATQSGSYPLSGDKFYVSNYSEPAENRNDSCAAYFPGSSGLIQKLANVAQGNWFVGEPTVLPDVQNTMALAVQQNAVPILIAYDIPIRDCAGYSGGGAPSAGEYQSWIQRFAQGIGQQKAVVILEPDALLQMPQAGCLNSAEQTERLQLLNYATYTLKQSAPNASVYLDAGRAGQYAIDPGQMGQWLNYAGIANTAGFSLNVSNYIATDITTSYGQQISAQVGGKHFVIDTSRNGLGADGDLNWCNPPGRGAGAPTQGLNYGSVDAYLWVQNPGSSDGSCNGAPPAGTFDLFLGCTLAQNAVF